MFYGGLARYHANRGMMFSSPQQISHTGLQLTPPRTGVPMKVLSKTALSKTALSTGVVLHVCGPPWQALEVCGRPIVRLWDAI